MASLVVLVQENHGVPSQPYSLSVAPSSHRILGLDIQSMTVDAATALLAGRLDGRQKTLVAFANANLLQYARKRPELLSALRQFLILNDGIALELASRLLHGMGFAANLNGTDFVPRLLHDLGGKRVFLYGARPEVVARAAARLTGEGIVVAGTMDGFQRDRSDAVRAANTAGADIVLVALGNPLQELWISEHAAALDAPLVLGVGALFDFLSGTVRRAPLWVQRAKLEWAFRLAQEPTRLVRRYAVDTPQFLFAAWRERRIRQ